MSLPTVWGATNEERAVYYGLLSEPDALTEDERAEVMVWVAEWNLTNTDTTSVIPGPLPLVLHREWPDFAQRHRLQVAVPQPTVETALSPDKVGNEDS